jgi:hypothetical protein
MGKSRAIVAEANSAYLYTDGMFRAERRSIDLPAVISTLAGRRVRIGEIIDALNLGRSTYYEQRDEGRLVSADNMLRLAAQMDLNPVELLVLCGLIEQRDVADCATKSGLDATAIGPSGKTRARRFQRRPDAPPL